jgi:hypothetical protein
MREAIALAFQVVWLAALLVGVAVALLARRPAGRRRLRRWVKLPTIVYWETERALGPGEDEAAVLAELRATVPGAGRSLLPPFYLVRLRQDGTGRAVVTLRAGTLMQAKTPEEAIRRLGEAITRSAGGGETKPGATAVAVPGAAARPAAAPELDAVGDTRRYAPARARPDALPARLRRFRRRRRRLLIVGPDGGLGR